jgi:phage-related protein
MPAPFNWPISNNSSVDVEPRVLEARFGNGFRQMVPDGINNVPYIVNVEIGPMEPAEAQACWTYLESVTGIPFPWTPPSPLPQVEMQWQARRYSWKSGGGLIRFINAVFELFVLPSTFLMVRTGTAYAYDAFEDYGPGGLALLGFGHSGSAVAWSGPGIFIGADFNYGAQSFEGMANATVTVLTGEQNVGDTSLSASNIIIAAQYDYGAQDFESLPNASPIAGLSGEVTLGDTSLSGASFVT